MKPLKIMLVLTLIGTLLHLVGCQSDVPRIGILIHSYENERWVKEKNYLVDNLAKSGADILLEVANSDQQKQIMQAAEMIKNGVKVLIVIAINQNEAAKIIEMAHEANVKVIAYDRLINGYKLDYYISANSYQIGELQASYIVSLKPKGNYALICGSKHDDNSMKLFLGQMKVLQPYMERGDIQLVYSEFTEDWSPKQGEIHTNRILDQYKDSLTAIIAGSDAIADGVLTALKERGLQGKVLVAGQDCELDNVKEIIAGNQTCDVLKPLKEMAALTAKLAVAIARDKKIDITFTRESNGKSLVNSVLLDASIVHKGNIESSVIASGFHEAADFTK